MGSYGSPTLKFTVLLGSDGLSQKMVEVCMLQLRLWGTLPMLHTLRRVLDIKQLRAALAAILVQSVNLGKLVLRKT